MNLTPADRNLYLYAGIDRSSVKSTAESILSIERSDRELEENLAKLGMKYQPKSITIYIDSPGGECQPGFGLISVMMMSKTPIRTVVTGSACSMALPIFLAGSERIIYPEGVVMYHQLMSYSAGYSKLTETEEVARHAGRTQDRIDKFISKRCRITIDQMRHYQSIKEDWYIEAKESVKLGIAHKIAKSNIL